MVGEIQERQIVQWIVHSLSHSLIIVLFVMTENTIMRQLCPKKWFFVVQKGVTYLVLQGVQFGGTQYVSQYANN